MSGILIGRTVGRSWSNRHDGFDQGKPRAAYHGMRPSSRMGYPVISTRIFILLSVTAVSKIVSCGGQCDGVAETNDKNLGACCDHLTASRRPSPEPLDRRTSEGT